MKLTLRIRLRRVAFVTQIQRRWGTKHQPRRCINPLGVRPRPWPGPHAPTRATPAWTTTMTPECHHCVFSRPRVGSLPSRRPRSHVKRLSYRAVALCVCRASWLAHAQNCRWITPMGALGIRQHSTGLFLSVSGVVGRCWGDQYTFVSNVRSLSVPLLVASKPACAPPLSMRATELY